MKKKSPRPAPQLDLFREMIVDNFAGGGGASTGIELATGRPVDVAINHDPDAILMHKTNHPYTKHYQASVWDIDPVQVCGGQKVGLAWFSPDCKHFSRAKGGKPRDKNIRGLAWIVLRWAGKVRPRVIILENVEEFQTWGPVRKGKPVKKLAGTTFERWKEQLAALGYVIEHRELRACDYGAPTIRKRFFLIARCDGRPIVWPEPTHGDPESEAIKSGKLRPWRSAAEIIDWSIPCPSIFETKQEIKKKYGVQAVRPLADNTMQRAARGLDKFVLKSAKPFLVPIGYGERPGQAPRVQSIDEPVSTIVSSAKQYLCKPVIEPWTVTKITTSCDLSWWPQIRDMLNKYCGYHIGADEILLLVINGIRYFISDIGLRMLTPRELYAANGFPLDYIIDHDYLGHVYGKTKQVARCGNAVPPPFAYSLVAVNLPELCVRHCRSMAELNDTIAV